MRKLNLIIIGAVVLTLMSCGGGGLAKQPANAEGFGAIETELKSKFGDNASYTELTITYNESIGNIVSTTVTDKPESLKMAEWSFSNGSWLETSELTLELPEGTNASDFMFQLNSEINLAKLGGLVEKSCTQLTADKNLENPMLSMAFVKFPDNGDVSNAEYVVMLKPATGGTTFTYSYKLDGELIKMDY